MLSEVTCFCYLVLVIGISSASYNNTSNDNTTGISSAIPFVLSPHIPPGLDQTKLEFKLALFWPQGFCQGVNSGCSTMKVPKDFTVHGLWPIYRGKCMDSTQNFDPSLVKDFRAILDGKWPNLNQLGKPKLYPEFWKHEWTKHGKRCNLYSVTDYFSQTLLMLEESNAKQIVENAGYPTSPNDLANAFNGRKPYIFCTKDNAGHAYLDELDFCLNHKLEYVDCPNQPTTKHECDKRQKFSYGT